MASASYRNFTGTGAQNYQRHFVPAIAAPVSGDLLAAADLRPGERVLDVACGTGLIARQAAARVGPTGSITAIDLAPDMIETAKVVPGPAEPQIAWHVGDAASLPFEEGAYDAVLCQMGLMFMQDRPAAVVEMRRVLAPGGRVVVNTPGAMQPVLQIMQQAIVEQVNPDLGRFVGAVFSMHDPEAVAGLLRGAGLKEVTAKVSVAPLRLPPPAEFLWQYINVTPMGPMLAGAPETVKTSLERQVVEGWQPYVVEGVLRVDQPMVIATGLK